MSQIPHISQFRCVTGPWSDVTKHHLPRLKTVRHGVGPHSAFLKYEFHFMWKCRLCCEVEPMDLSDDSALLQISHETSGKFLHVCGFTYWRYQSARLWAVLQMKWYLLHLALSIHSTNGGSHPHSGVVWRHGGGWWGLILILYFLLTLNCKGAQSLSRVVSFFSWNWLRHFFKMKRNVLIPNSPKEFK